MRILVIDDNINNQSAALAQLGNDHELTVAGSYDNGQKLIQDKLGFEVVLVDLLMPASARAQGPVGKQFVGQEMPIGIFLALLAAKNGAKFVAVFTDSDHHSHPASACFDAFSGAAGPTSFMVEGAKVLLSNERNWVNDFHPNNLAKKMGTEEMLTEKEPPVRAKNWGKLLDYLIRRA